MSLKDWEIFYKYSIRVRCVLSSGCSAEPELELLSQGWEDLGDDVISALSNPPRYRPLIPCLRELHWDEPKKKYEPLLRLLLIPSLDTLSLKSFDFSQLSILTSIGTTCPSLRTLCIFSLHWFPDHQGEKSLSEAILYLHSLESLICLAVDEAAIVHLSRLPLHRELSVELRQDFKLNNLTCLAPPAFRSIDSLTLTATSLATLTSLLEPMQITPSQVSFTAEKEPTVDSIQLFFLVLVNVCSSERLSQVSLYVNCHSTALPQPEEITLSTFQCLLALPSITSFKLDVPCAILLDDAGLTTLAKHWPNLTELLINQDRGWGPLNHITHQGLLNLLSHCSDISRFSLCVDFSDIDVSNSRLSGSRPSNGVTNEKCTVADFVTSTITNPVAIAAFLSDIFPNLVRVNEAWGDDPTMSEEGTEDIEVYQQRWEEVEGLVPAFAAVRRQCLDWYQKETKVGDAASV